MSIDLNADKTACEAWVARFFKARCVDRSIVDVRISAGARSHHRSSPVAAGDRPLPASPPSPLPQAMASMRARAGLVQGAIQRVHACLESAQAVGAVLRCSAASSRLRD
jgi:hypothetical protein